MAWGGGKVYGDGGCLQGDDSPAHTASCTVTTLIMIFNPADASVASIVPANEGARGGGRGGLRHFNEDFSWKISLSLTPLFFSPSLPLCVGDRA